MRKNWILVIVGMALWVGSFFLVAVQEANTPYGGSGYRGYLCAFITLINVWGHDAMAMLRETPVEYFSTLLSGWINPVFLITLMASLVRPKGRLAVVLRIVFLLMLPACWIVFYKMKLYPREGYFVWTAGMLLVMFAAPGARVSREPEEIGPAVGTQVRIS